MKAIKTTLGQNGMSLYIKALMFGITVSCAVIAAMLCIASMLLNITGVLPKDIIVYAVLGICGLAVFCGGYVTARTVKANGLLFGAICGFLIFLITLIAGLSVNNGTLTYITFIKLALLVVLGGIGGIRGVNRKQKLRI